MKRRKLFGTDGIRGTANVFPMTTDIAMQVGRATAFLVRQKLGPQFEGKPKIVIGKDTRLSGYMIEQALSSGICSMGANSLLVGPLPTPGIAFLTHNMRADAGIVISASHNMFQDNGIKIFDKEGFKLPLSEEEEIENYVLNGNLTDQMPTAEGVGKTFRIDDALGRYVVYVKNTFPRHLTLQGLRIVLDCANGAAYKVAPWVFEELGAEVIKLGVSPNGVNINDKCGALYPEQLARAVLEYRADLGISLDGDADRVILADERGQVVNGDHVLLICAVDLKEKKQLPHDTIVATHMSNIGMEIGLRKFGIKVHYTDVGDKHVVDAMRKNGYFLGGEQSGHTIFLESSTTGDGLVAALRVLGVMIGSGKKLSTLRKMMTDIPQVLRNVRISRRKDLNDIGELSKLVGDIKEKLSDKGRVFVRASGTEPVVRILVEGPDRDQINLAAEKIASLIQSEMG